MKSSCLRAWQSRLRGAFRHPGYLLWVAAAYLPFLQRAALPLTGDQRVYLSTAMEMREAGSWLQPLLFGAPSYYKPPFQYWATLLGWKLFGFSYLGAWMPSVLALLGTAWFLGEIAILLQEKRPFVNAGLWFAATVGAVTFGTTAQMEIWVCFFYAGAWWAGLRFLERDVDERQVGWLYVAFALTGVSAWVKSPLYSVFWVFSFLTYLFIQGHWEEFGRKRLYFAWLVGAMIGSFWFVAMFARDGSQFWADYALRETWNKRGGNQGTALELWASLLFFCLPFTPLLIPALRLLSEHGRKSRQVWKFVFAWSWPAALFFSFYPYRVSTYLFLLAPAAAFLIDWGYYRAGRKRLSRGVAWLTGGLFASGMAALGALAWATGFVAPFWGALFGGVGVWGLQLAVRDRMRAFALTALVALLLCRSLVVTLGERDLEGFRAAAEIPGWRERSWAIFDEQRNIWSEVGYLSLALGKPIRRLYQEQEVLAAVRAGDVVILSETQKKRLQTLAVHRASSDGAAEVRWHPWFRILTRAEFDQALAQSKTLPQTSQSWVGDVWQGSRKILGTLYVRPFWIASRAGL